MPPPRTQPPVPAPEPPTLAGPALPESLGHALDSIELPSRSRTLEDAAGYESLAIPRVLPAAGPVAPFEFDMAPARGNPADPARRAEERPSAYVLEDVASSGSASADLPSLPPSLLDAFPTSPTDVEFGAEPDWARLFPEAARVPAAGLREGAAARRDGEGEPVPAAAAEAPPPPPQAAAPAAESGIRFENLDADLARAFARLSPGGDGPAGDPLPPCGSGGQGDDATHDVPAGLRGMDRGTAELLSSLEELEQDIPEDHSGLLGETNWTGTAGFSEAPREVEPSVPHPLPPRADSELEELIARAEKAPGPPPAPPLPELEAPVARVQSTPDPLPPPSDWKPPAPELEVEPLAGSVPSEPMAGSERSPSGRRRTRDATREPAPAPAPPKKRNAFASWLLGGLTGVILISGIAAGFRQVVGDAWEAPARPVVPVYPDESDVAPMPPRAALPPPAERSASPAERSASPADRVAVVTHGPARDATAPARPAPAVIRPRPRAAADERRERERARPVAATAAELGEPSPAGPEPAVLAAPPEDPTGAPDPASGAPLLNELPIVRASELDAPLRQLTNDPPASPVEPSPDGTVRRVYLNVLVGPDGTVEQAKVLADPGEGLGAAAREAVLRWTYSAPRRGTGPVRVWKAEVVEFP